MSVCIRLFYIFQNWKFISIDWKSFPKLADLKSMKFNSYYSSQLVHFSQVSSIFSFIQQNKKKNFSTRNIGVE